MTLACFRPCWRIGRGPACFTSGALPHAGAVLSGVSPCLRSSCRHVCSVSASAPRFSRHQLRHQRCIAPHAIAHVHVHSNVQTACPERAMPMAWLAFAGRHAAPCAAPPGHRIPVPLGRGKMQGKIEGAGTLPALKRVCTWGWRGTRLWTAPCCQVPQSLVGIGETMCMARSGATAFAGAAP